MKCCGKCLAANDSTVTLAILLAACVLFCISALSFAVTDSRIINRCGPRSNKHSHLSCHVICIECTTLLQYTCCVHAGVNVVR